MRTIAIGLFAVTLALPTFAQKSLTEQGRDAINRREYERAVAILEKAAAAAPNSAETQYLLGSAYGMYAQRASMWKQMSLAGKAKGALERAIQLDPNHIDARWGLMEFLSIAPGIAGGSKEKALQQAHEILKRDRVIGHRAIAQLLIREKKIDEARKEYMDSVREQPSSAKAHYGLGVFYLTVDQNNKGATDEFETSIRLDPSYMSGWFQVGHMAALTGSNFARGEEALRKYLAYTPKHNEPSHARAHFWLGQIFEKQGKKAEARQAYATSLRLNPDQKDVTEAMKRVS